MAITGRRPTLTDCGCEATVYADGSGIELHYCPMHQAAPQLLEALRTIAKGEGRFSRDPLIHASNTVFDMKILAVAAIAAAEEADMPMICHNCGTIYPAAGICSRCFPTTGNRVPLESDVFFVVAGRLVVPPESLGDVIMEEMHRLTEDRSHTRRNER